MSDNAGVNAAASLSLHVGTDAATRDVELLETRLDSLLIKLGQLAAGSSKVSIASTLKSSIIAGMAEAEKRKFKPEVDTSQIDAQLAKYKNLVIPVTLNLTGARLQLDQLRKQLVIPVKPVMEVKAASAPAPASGPTLTSAREWANVVIQQQKTNNELQRTLDTLTSKGQTVVTQASKDLINFSSTISGAAKRFSIKPEEAVKGLQLLTGRFTEAKALVEKGIDLSQVNKMADTMRMLGNNTASGVSKSIEYLTKLQNRLKQLPEGTSAADVKKTYIQQFGIDPTTIDAELAALQRRQDIQTRWDERRTAQRKKALAEEKAINDSYDAEAKRALRIWRQVDAKNERTIATALRKADQEAARKDREERRKALAEEKAINDSYDAEAKRALRIWRQVDAKNERTIAAGLRKADQEAARKDREERRKALAEEKAINDSYDAEAKRALRIWRQDDKRITGGIARRAETTANVDFKDFFGSQTIAAATQGYIGVGKQIYAANEAANKFGYDQAKAFLGTKAHLLELIGTLDTYNRKLSTSSVVNSFEARSKLTSRLSPEILDRQLGITNKPSAVAQDYLMYGAAPANRGASTLAKLEAEDAAKVAKQLADANDKVAESHKKAAPAAAGHAAKLKELKDQAWDAHSAARGLAGGLNMLWLTYGATIPLMTGAALSGGFLAAAKAGSEFAYQLTFVKALGGETADTMRSISETTLAMSKGTMQGPLEMAQGLRILSQAGLDAQKSLQALPSVLDLAVVGEMKMEQAAVTLTGVMNAFSLSVADMPRIGDVFAKAAAVSQTSVVGMTEAMKTASVVGEQYGASMEDTATALTLLAKMNISGTAAGTSLRNMLKELYTPGAEAAKVMKTLGLNAFDAQGKMRDFPSVIYDLKERLRAFDKESQVNILQRLFGERGAKEAIAMLSLTRTQWDELNDSINKSSGFIRGVAAELEMTTKGRFQQAISTFQANLIDAFNKSEGPMRGLADNFRKLADSPEIKEGLNTIVAGVASLTNALVQLTPTLIRVGEAWVVWKGVTIAVGALSALGTATTAASASVGAFVAARAALTGTAGIASLTALKAGLDGVAVAATAAGGSTALGGVAAALARLLSPLGVAVTAIGALSAAYLALSRDTPKSVQDTDNFIAALDRQISKVEQENAALREQIKLKKLALGLGDEDLDTLQKEKRKIDTDLAKAVKEGRDGPLIEKLLQQREDVRTREQKLVAGQSESVRNNLTLTIADLQSAADKLDQSNEKVAKLQAKLKSTQANLGAFTLPVQQKVQSEYLRKLLTDAQLESGTDKFKIPKNADIAEGYRENLAELKNFTQQYEAIYTQFTEGTRLKTLKGELAETDAIRANTAARISLYEAEIKKQEAIIALAERNRGTRGAGRDIEDAEGKIATLRTKIETAVIEGNNQIITVNEKLSADIAKAWALAGKQSVNEIDVLTAKFYAENQNLLRAMAAGSVEAGNAVAAAVDAIAKKTQFSQANKVFEASLATIQTRVAEIEEEISSSGGGWIQRWIGGEEIFAIVQSNIDALTAKIEDLKRKAAEMEPGSTDRAEADKQIAQYQKQLTTLKKSTGKVWADVIQNIDKTFHDGFVRMLEGGKDGWEAWAKSLKNTFKSIVADSIYQMFARPFVLNVVGNVAGMIGANGLATAANNAAAGGAFNLVGSAGSSLLSGAVGSGLVGLGGAIGSGTAVGGFATGLGTSLANGVGFSGTMTAGKALAALPGGGAAGLGMQVGAFMPYVGAALAVATAIGAFGKTGAPKVDIGFGGRITPQGRNYDVSGLNFWNGSKNTEQAANTILTDNLVAALKRINSNYSGAAFLTGHLNIKGRSSNQQVAQVKDSSGALVYHNFKEEGKGSDDFQKFVADQIPKLQLALIVDAMRTAGSDMQSIANAVVGTTGDLTQAIDQLDSAGVTNTIKNLENLGFVFKSIKNSIDDSITGEAVGLIAKFATSVSTLAENLAGYEQNYLSNAERASNQFKELKAVFDSLNLAMPTSKAGFRYLVESLDKTSDGGAKAFVALMDIQGAFASWADVMNAGSVSAKDAADNLRKAYKDQETELTNTIKKFSEYSKSLKDFRVGLLTGSLSPLDTRGRYAEAKSQFELTRAKALLGDETAIESLESVATTFLELSREMFASGDAYTQDFNAVIEAVAGTESLAVRHLRIADAQLNTLKEQVESLITINDNVISLKDALSQFTLSTLQGADRGTVSLNTIKGMYSDILGREADASGLAYWQKQSGNMSGSELLRAFLTAATQPGNTDAVSAEAWAKKMGIPGFTSNTIKGMYSDILGREADASGLAYWQKQSGNMSGSELLRAFLTAATQPGNPDAVSARSWAKKMGIPGFASGGFHSGGIRLVGESGMEIEATGPARYWDADKTRQFLTRGTTADESTVVLQQIKAEIAQLREEQARQTGDLIRSNFAANQQVADKIQPEIKREPARFTA